MPSAFPEARFLTEFGRDAVAVAGLAGAAVGLLGVAATLIGLWLTWKQLKKTATASAAAATAAAESRDAYERLIRTLSLRAAANLRNLVRSEEWWAASLTASDIAELLVQLSDPDGSTRNLADGMRAAAETFSRIADPKDRLTFNRDLRKEWPRRLAAVEKRISAGLIPTPPTNRPDP